MKPDLQTIIDKNFDNEDLEYEISEILPTSPAKKLELTWLAGRLAFLFPANKSLAESSNVENSAKYNSESFFLIKSMKNSIILKPSEGWMQDLIKMDSIFCIYNGENSLKTGRGLIARLLRILINEFPSYDIAILKTFAYLRTAIQIKSINKAVELKKKSKMSKKGAQKTVRMAGY